MGNIYIITNKINNKIYVGKTERTIETRWKEHINAMSSSNKKHYKLYAAMNKYGIENFSIDLLEKCPNSLLNEREIYWIKKLNSYDKGYNMTLGGDGTSSIEEEKIFELWNQGQSVSQISETLGYDRTTITKRLQGYINYSQELSKARGAELCATSKFKKIYIYNQQGNKTQEYNNSTEAAIELHMDIKQIRTWCRKNFIKEGFLYSYDILAPEEIVYIFLHQKNHKAVEQINLDGYHVRTYVSIQEAMRTTGINNINLAASGKIKTAGGYIWKYVDDFQENNSLPTTTQGRKKVAQYSLDGNLIQIYESITDAAKQTGQKSSSNISQVCKGKAKTAGGFIWKYYEKSDT